MYVCMYVCVHICAGLFYFLSVQTLCFTESMLSNSCAHDATCTTVMTEVTQIAFSVQNLVQ